MSPVHVVVIGAGAAGLTAAVRAAEGGAHVTLLNAHPKIGLKILMSGGTRCNVTHREVSERDFHGGSRHFVARVLRAFTVDETLAWFGELGVTLKLEPTGKYFPDSDDAQTVLDALLGHVALLDVAIESGTRAVRLERTTDDAAVRAALEAESEAIAAAMSGAHGIAGAAASAAEAAREARVGWRVGVVGVRDAAALGAAAARHGVTEWPLPVLEPERWIEADRVVLATGGLSFPRTGSDGTGYALARAAGHTIEPPVPALTPLASEDPWCKALQGTTVDAELRLMTGDRKPAAVARGSLLFAHFGYSGPPALDLSRHWLRADGGERRVLASFLPGESEASLLELFVRVGDADPRATVRSLLGARLPDRFVTELCYEANIDAGKFVSQVSKPGRTALVQALLARELPVTGTLGYEKAEVTAGGVRLAEVDSSTLESRVARGLYLCGEVLDVEGRLGGFNFQWSWSSGTVAGRAAGAAVRDK